MFDFALNTPFTATEFSPKWTLLIDLPQNIGIYLNKLILPQETERKDFCIIILGVFL